jgi:8-oxo-(d)GTP phosphatase
VTLGRDIDADATVVRAAGGIVVRGVGDERRFAVVHRPRYDDWSFPKGKLDAGETEEIAALREVLEETGLRCRLETPVGAVTYTDRTGRPKVVRYWTMMPEGGTFEPNDEVDDLRWVGADDALAILSYAHDRELLRAVLGPDVAAPVYLVRHAKAGERATWTRPDEERPLTTRGVRQAGRLVGRFDGLDVARIVSSPYVRCIQTVEPLARSRGLEVERVDELAEGADLARAVGFVGSLDARPTVACGHGGEIEAILGAFERRGADLEGARTLAKGSVWVLDRRGGAVVSARSLPAPSA